MSFFVRGDKGGFLMAELLVVAAVIGLLVAVVSSNISEGKKKGNDSQRQSDISQLQLTLRMYKDGEGMYPDYDGGIVIGEGGALDAILGGYLTGAIRDPLGSGEYEYVYDSDFSCPALDSGAPKSYTVLYARSMERAAGSNWAEVCGGTLPGTNTYGVVLKTNN